MQQCSLFNPYFKDFGANSKYIISTMNEENGEGQIRGVKKQASGFAQYSFMYNLYKAIMTSGLKMPTPVQRKVIPVVMSGKDAIVCYKTGSGKTLSYLLPLINKLKCHSKIIGARALILIPTKDLAEQIAKVLKQFTKFTDLKYTLVLGGHTYEGQFESLSTNPDIIIATPGRLMQLLQETDLRLGRIQTIVYDEADQLFENGSFFNQLKQISSKCPISQRLMFSATINQTLNEFAKSGLKQYSYIHQEIALPSKMTLDAFIVRSEDKPGILLFLIEKVVLENKVLIFASTRYHVDFLVALVGEVYDCDGIYGKMDTEQRTSALDKFRRAKGRSILIVTDVAARGLDIPSVEYVIHYDYPTNHKTFVHRSGRTARKEESGHTIALISNNQLPYITELAQYVGRSLTSESIVKETINIGSIPVDIVDSYNGIVRQLKDKNDEIIKLQEVANKAFEKFKSCRSQVLQSSVRKSKNIEILVHFKFRENQDQEEVSFLKRIKNFTPKKSFLELQRIMADHNPENDLFLGAVEKIRHEETSKKQQQKKKEKLREKNSLKWQEMLNKEQLKELEAYKNTAMQINRKSILLPEVEGVDVELVSKEKKSTKKDFRNPSQYISAVKTPGVRTEFDDLPKIKNSELDENIGDENPQRRRKERVWDKEKKNYVWKKDKEDKGLNQEKGKIAYQKWKKKSRLSIPKIGQVQNEEQIGMAKQNWLQRRKFRHGWKQAKTNEKHSVNLKNNKTKAIEKKYKKNLISKSQKSKAGGKAGKRGASGKGGKRSQKG